MRRIHDLLSLTLGAYELAHWFYDPIGAVRPIDSLRSGEKGLREIDMMLCEGWKNSAPRKIFDIPGKVAESAIAAEGAIILKLLRDHEEDNAGQGSGLIHDPIRFDKHILNDQEGRLAAAVTDYLSRESEPIARDIFYQAMRDQDLRIRRAAAGAAVSLGVGYPDVEEVLHFARFDDDFGVRILAAEALSSAVENLRVATKLADFLEQGRPPYKNPGEGQPSEVRIAAIKGFVGKTLKYNPAEILMNSVFDDEREVARLTQLVVDAQDIADTIRFMMGAYYDGETTDWTQVRELIRAASKTELIPETEREKVIVFALAKAAAEGLIEEEAEGVEDLTPTHTRKMREIIAWVHQAWVGPHTPEFWTALQQIPGLVGNPDMVGQLMSFISKAADPESWSLLDAMLSTDLDDESAQVHALAETAVRLGRTVPKFMVELIRFAKEPSRPEARRDTVLSVLARSGISAQASDEMRSLYMSESETPRIAKRALVTAVHLVATDRRAAVLGVALSAPIAEVRSYAQDALVALARDAAKSRDEPRSEVEARKSGDVVDLTDARMRHAKAKSRVTKGDS
jgi:hypothetical protein